MKGITNITYKGIPLEVEYDFIPMRFGVWTLPNGDPGYPDEPAEMDIEAINLCGINIYELLSVETINAIDEITFDKIQYE